MSDMTATDFALMNGNCNGMTNNPFIWLVFLMLTRYWGNGDGFNAAAQGSLTRAELTEGLNFQTMDRNLTDIRDAVSAVGAAVQTSSAGLSDKLCCGFSSVNSSIAQASFAQQNSACEINRNIDAIRYQLAQDTCAITSAIREDGEKTRALMTANTIQDLRDSREAVQRELQSAQLTLANGVQTQNILNSVGRYVPYAGCGGACGCAAAW